MDLALIALTYGGLIEVEVPEDAPSMFNVIAAKDFLFHGDFGLIVS